MEVDEGLALLGVDAGAAVAEEEVVFVVDEAEVGSANICSVTSAAPQAM